MERLWKRLTQQRPFLLQTDCSYHISTTRLTCPFVKKKKKGQFYCSTCDHGCSAIVLLSGYISWCHTLTISSCPICFHFRSSDAFLWSSQKFRCSWISSTKTRLCLENVRRETHEKGHIRSSLFSIQLQTPPLRMAAPPGWHWGQVWWKLWDFPSVCPQRGKESG